MPIPDHVAELRRLVGPMELWMPGVTAVVRRDSPSGTDVLFVRRADTGEWTPVTGILDPGEEAAVGAVREVLEETCVVARVSCVTRRFHSATASPGRSPSAWKEPPLLPLSVIA